jgi:hypothetical protein
MSSPSLHPSSDADNADRENEASGVRITVTVANRFTFDARRLTGRQIKEATGVPTGFALYRRTPSGNEPIPDDAKVELHNGDHFFARPSSSNP